MNKISTGIFWYWNATPVPSVMRRQLESMKKANFDCVYLHPMPDGFHKHVFLKGMEIPYMGERYLELARFMLEECKRLGLSMMLYDEGGWPSGGCLGRMVEEHPENCAVFLKKNEAGVIEKVVEPFPDLLRKKTTLDFIEMAYEPYWRELGDEFGKTIKGIFTDEPFWRVFRYWEDMIRYTPEMESVAQEFYNCSYEKDIVPLLWQGCGKLPGSTEARRRYLDICSELFARNYSDVLGKWCSEHNIALEGHLDNEDTFFYDGAPGNFIRRLDGFQTPGVDVIWRQIYPGTSHGFWARFAQAAAIRSNHADTLCECFNVYTYAITPRIMNFVANDLMVKGITRVLPMPYLYGDRGKRKVCCSTDFSPRTPQWDAFPALNAMWKWAGNFNAGAMKPDVWLYTHVEHPCIDGADPQLEKNAAYAAKVADLCVELDKKGVFYRFADENDLRGSERPRLVIVPSDERIPALEDFPCVSYGIPENIGEYAFVRVTEKNGCFILPVMRPEGEALMVFNPDQKKVEFNFASENKYVELLPPDPGYSTLHPLKQKGENYTLPMAPEQLRILLKNGEAPELPVAGEKVTASIRWQVKKVERLKFSLHGITRFEKEKMDIPLPGSGRFTDIEKDFSGRLVLEGVIDSPRAGRVLIELDRVEHTALLKINGGKAHLRPCGPWIFEGVLREGKNKVTLTVSSSAGNEFRRCFREELEKANYVNTYARRFTKYAIDDAHCGAGKKITVTFIK